MPTDSQWEGSGPRFAAVQAAEIELLSPDVRGDSSRVAELLDADFAEIGRSGRLWDRDGIIAALATDDPDRVAPETSEWRFRDLGSGRTLLTYLITGPSGSSRHASLWGSASGAPILLFHQGTVVPAE